jgi:RNA polymerase sigma-70 factor (ECF subfamily)
MYLTRSGASQWASNDEAAVAEARTGNADAFRVLVERHGRAVYRLAFRMTGNEHDAEDLVQETFLRACKQLDKFDGRASFATWLYRIASNCSVDLLRSRQSRERRMVNLTPFSQESESAGDPLERFAAGSPSPERLSMSSEFTRLLTPAMRQLSEKERAAFVLRHYEGLSIEQISEALNIRPSAAKHSIFRAVQKLRRVLEPALGTRSTRTAS